jgi:hypothetical protein
MDRVLTCIAANKLVIVLIGVNCLRLLRHTARLPCSLTLFSAGINTAINIAIMAITTKSSTNVNPFRLPIMIPFRSVSKINYQKFPFICAFLIILPHNHPQFKQ